MAESNRDKFIKRFIRALTEENIDEYLHLWEGFYAGTEQGGHLVRLLGFLPEQMRELLNEDEYLLTL